MLKNPAIIKAFTVVMIKSLVRFVAHGEEMKFKNTIFFFVETKFVK